ncbi:ESPR-type extended signal peptide-containing protein, partial [Dialister micraerophilus]|uniref:ESPR-type extended signal peptide-containing protein n=1 Tax=Dialister micraerophilus TaxID=309120 RepID=UPI0023F46EB9
MNRAYKLIWNNARNMYIAVSEIAKSHRKETLRGGKKTAAIFLAALYLCGTGFAANTVQAENNSPVLTDEQKNEIADKVLEKLKNNENIKILKSQFGIHYFSVKSNDNTSPDGTNWNNDGAIGENAIAIGSKARAYGLDSNATGVNAWSIGNYSQAWGYFALAGVEEGIDKSAYDALSDEEKKNYILREMSIGGVDKYLYYRTTFKEYTNDEFNALTEQKRKDLMSNKGYGYLSGKKVWTPTPRAIAIGHLSKAIGAATVAVGNLTEATGLQSTAIGTQANASGGFSFAAGDRASAQKTGTIAIGMKASASGEWSTAVGLSAEAQSEKGVALGASASVDKKGATSIGYKAKGSVENGVALGAYSTVDREKGKIGYALDGDNSTLEKVMESTGQKAKYDELTGKIDPLKDEYNGLLKAYLDAPTNSSEETTAKQKSDAWIAGHSDFISAVKEKKQMIAAWQSSNGAVSVGSAGATRQITNVAAGSEDTDAVNVAQLKALNNKVDAKPDVHYISIKKNKPLNDKLAGSNWNNDGATGDGAIAIGSKVKAENRNSISIGEGITKNKGKFGIAIGATGNSGEVAPEVKNEHGIAVGSGTVADSSGIALGLKSKNTTGYAISIGRESESGYLDIAMGYKAKAEDKQSIAIGTMTQVNGFSSVAIGSQASAIQQTTVSIGYAAKTESEGATAVGEEASVASGGNYATAIGSSAYVGKIITSGGNPETGVPDNYFTKTGEDDTPTIEAGKEYMNSMAVGFGAKSYGYQTTAIGAGAEAYATDSLAMGVLAKAKSKHSVALGKEAFAEGWASMAFGRHSLSKGNNAVALGHYASVARADLSEVQDSVALGAYARAMSNNSIAIGKESLARVKEGELAKGYLTNSVFNAVSGVVSVGNEEYQLGDKKIAANYRRLTNVADGAADHDVVTVAQLKKVKDMVDAKVGDVTTINQDITNLKGGFTIKDTATGTVNVTLGETTKSAITFKAETKNDDGATSALTAKVDADKNVTYTLNTKKLKEEMGLNNLGTGTMSSWKLKVGTDSTDISNGNEVTFAASTDEATKGLSVKKKGNVITYGINKGELVGNIAGDIITEINKTTNTTKITNVDWSKFPGMNFYTQGSVNSGIYTPDANADNKWNSSHIVFGEGIKVEKLKDKDNNQVTKISLDGIGGTGTNGKDGKSAYDIWLETQTDKTKTKQDFLDSLKGKDGTNGTNGTKGTDGKDGTNGKSAYEIWEAHVDKDGTQPNKGKGEQDFLDSLKGKDGIGEDKVNEITKRMNEFNTESVRGDALGAALSALKPLDYDPYNRSQIMAGVSTYKGQEAIALGLAYYSNENTLLHAGLSYAGSSELMANAGISYKFGSSYDRKLLNERNKLMPQYKGGVISSVYVMQDEMAKLQKENAELKNEVKEANERTKQIENETNARIAKLEA